MFNFGFMTVEPHPHIPTNLETKNDVQNIHVLRNLSLSLQCDHIATLLIESSIKSTHVLFVAPFNYAFIS
jgi:hypothetical protein